MDTDPPSTLFDRLAFAFLGALVGLAYGAAISFVVLLATERGRPWAMFWTAVAFAVMGFTSSNFLLKASIAFLWGLIFVVMGLYLFTDLYPLRVLR